MREFEAIIPIKPLAKQSTRFSNGRAYTDGKYLDWQKNFVWLCKKSSPELVKARFSHHVNLQVIYGFEYLKRFPKYETMIQWDLQKQKKEGVYIDGATIYKTTRPDVHDNLNKLLVDTLTRMRIIPDDSIVTTIIASKVYDLSENIYLKIEGL